MAEQAVEQTTQSQEVTETPDIEGATPTGEEQQSTPPVETETTDDPIKKLEDRVQGLEAGITAERKKRQIAEQTFLQTQQPSQEEDEETFLTKADVEKVLEAKSAKEQQARQDQAFRQKLDQAQEFYKDERLVEIVQDETLPISPAMADVLRSSDKPAELLVHLNKNRDEAMRLSQLSPTAAALEMGRLESKLEAPKPNAVSNAPEPIETVGDRGAMPAGYPGDNCTVSQYEEWARKQRGGSVWPK